MKRWDPDGTPAPVGGVPDGCRAVPVSVVRQHEEQLVEIRDRRGRQKTAEIVLVADPTYPATSAAEADRRFALSAGRRRWSTIVSKYSERASDVALTLVRSGVVHLICAVDGRGTVAEPRWWEPTPAALAAAADEASSLPAGEIRAQRESLAAAVDSHHPELAAALRRTATPSTIGVLVAAAEDLLAGISHAGPRAFIQAHFGSTKLHNVGAILSNSGIPLATFDALGLQRGDRIGLGGPITLTTEHGVIDLTPLRGPTMIRLDQRNLRVTTTAETVLVLENLQPAEALCVHHPNVPVVYTAGQFGDSTGELISQLGRSNKRIIAIVDSDLGGVRIARRILAAAPDTEVVDVGDWSHPERAPFASNSITIRDLRGLAEDPLVGWFAAAVLERGYPVEQELATLEIVNSLMGL